MLETNMRFDHLAIVADNLEELRVVFQKIFGFEIYYDKKYIGDEETGMETFVVKRGSVEFAFMRGCDDPRIVRAPRMITPVYQELSGNPPPISQIGEYFRRFGTMTLQHVAIRVDDIEGLVGELYRRGVRFLTADIEGRPGILTDENDEGKVYQCFTLPICGGEGKGLFFEFKQIAEKSSELKTFQEFRDSNVEGLWASVRRKIESMDFFNLNIFGEECSLSESLEKRGYKVPLYRK